MNTVWRFWSRGGLEVHPIRDRFWEFSKPFFFFFFFTTTSFKKQTESEINIILFAER